MIKDFYPFKQCDHIVIDATDDGELQYYQEKHCHRCRNLNFYFDYVRQPNGDPKWIDGEKKPSLDLFKLLQIEPGSNLFMRSWGTPLEEFIGKKLTGNAILTKIKSEVSNAANMLISLQQIGYYNIYLDRSQIIQQIKEVFVRKLNDRTVSVGVVAELQDGSVISSTTEIETK